MQLIMLKQDFLLMVDVFGSINLCLKLVLLVQNVTVRLLFQNTHNPMVTLLTLLKRISLYVLLKISQIKLSTASNMPEKNLRNI